VRAEDHGETKTAGLREGGGLINEKTKGGGRENGGIVDGLPQLREQLLIIGIQEPLVVGGDWEGGQQGSEA